jgi:hypothetical protein
LIYLHAAPLPELPILSSHETDWLDREWIVANSVATLLKDSFRMRRDSGVIGFLIG